MSTIKCPVCSVNSEVSFEPITQYNFIAEENNVNGINLKLSNCNHQFPIINYLHMNQLFERLNKLEAKTKHL
jgi:hypothetical protein